MYKYHYPKVFDFALSIPSFSERYTKLKNSKKKNVIYIKDIFDSSTFRYRAYNVMETMSRSKEYFVTCFLVTELKNLYDLIDKIDLIVLQRAKWSFELDNFIVFAHRNHKKIIYDMDDLVYHTKYVPEYLSSISDYSDFKIDSSFAMAKRFEMVAMKCDGFIVTTDKLVKHFEKDFEKPAWLLPNYLNLEQEYHSNRVCELRKNSKRDGFVIGYFSGSNTHRKDLDIVESSLVNLVDKYDDVYVKIVGIMDLSEPLLRLKRQGRVFVDGYVSYEELPYKIGEVDLNIVPLQQHAFNDCKSELKYFEASIVKVPTIASNNVVYKKVIENGKDGFLCEDSEWFDCLESCYLNQKKLAEVAEVAYKKCLERYSNDNQLEKITKIYDEILK